MLEENKSVPVSFFAERKCTRQRSWLMSTLLGVVILCGPSVADAANRVLYYHNDTLGSPVAMTDSSGTIVWQPIISRSMI